MFAGLMSVPPERMWKPTRMTSERDEHAEQAHVDLGRREHARATEGRGERRRLRVRRGVGDVGSSGRLSGLA